MLIELRVNIGKELKKNRKIIFEQISISTEIIKTKQIKNLVNLNGEFARTPKVLVLQHSLSEASAVPPGCWFMSWLVCF